MPTVDESTTARRYLHVNLNTHDVDATAGFLHAVLGVTETMRSGGPDVVTDGAVLGRPGPVRSSAAFLYDARGPRVACAAEVVQWHDPATTGEPYADPDAVGIAALGYTVPDVEAVTARAVEHGAQVDGAILTIPGGARLDLVAGEGETRVRHVRQNVRSLDRSLPWYETVGFAVLERSASDAVLRLPDEEQTLLLQETAATGEPYAEPTHAGLFRTALAVDDPVAAQERLTAAGAADRAELHALDLPGTRVGMMRILVLRDPDGVMVELVERPRAIFRERTGTKS